MCRPSFVLIALHIVTNFLLLLLSRRNVSNDNLSDVAAVARIAVDHSSSIDVANGKIWDVSIQFPYRWGVRYHNINIIFIQSDCEISKSLLIGFTEAI